MSLSLTVHLAPRSVAVVDCPSCLLRVQGLIDVADHRDTSEKLCVWAASGPRVRRAPVAALQDLREDGGHVPGLQGSLARKGVGFQALSRRGHRRRHGLRAQGQVPGLFLKSEDVGQPGALQHRAAALKAG